MEIIYRESICTEFGIASDGIYSKMCNEFICIMTWVGDIIVIMSILSLLYENIEIIHSIVY